MSSTQLTRTRSNGMVMVFDGDTTYLYGPDEGRMDNHYLGKIVKRGIFKSSPRFINEYVSMSGGETSDGVFDIFGPKGQMLVKGCITGTLWAHVDKHMPL